MEGGSTRRRRARKHSGGQETVQQTEALAAAKNGDTDTTGSEKKNTDADQHAAQTSTHTATVIGSAQTVSQTLRILYVHVLASFQCGRRRDHG